MRPFQFPLLLKTASKCNSFCLWDPVANTSWKTCDQNLWGDNATDGTSHLLQDYWVVSFKRQMRSCSRRHYFRACCFMHKEMRSFLQIFHGEWGDVWSRTVIPVWALLTWLRAVELIFTTDRGLEPLRLFNKNEGGLNRSLKSLEWWEIWPGCTESAITTKITGHFMLEAHLRAIMIFKSTTKYCGYDLGGAARYWAGKRSPVVFEQSPLKAVLDWIFFYDSYV